MNGRAANNKSVGNINDDEERTLIQPQWLMLTVLSFVACRNTSTQKVASSPKALVTGSDQEHTKWIANVLDSVHAICGFAGLFGDEDTPAEPRGPVAQAFG